MAEVYSVVRLNFITWLRHIRTKGLLLIPVAQQVIHPFSTRVLKSYAVYTFPSFLIRPGTGAIFKCQSQSSFAWFIKLWAIKLSTSWPHAKNTPSNFVGVPFAVSEPYVHQMFSDGGCDARINIVVSSATHLGCRYPVGSFLWEPFLRSSYVITMLPLIRKARIAFE